MNEALVVVVRGLIAFFSLLIFTRLLGKQQVGQLTFFDYILGITIGSTASSLTTDLTSRAWPHFVGLVVWVAAVFLLEVITSKSRRASKYIDGEPVVVIMNGKIMDNAMRKMYYRIDELQQQLRDKGAFNVDEVQFAVLETNGTLSVLKKQPYQPVTPNDLNLPGTYSGLTSEVIYDGVVIEQNLHQRKLSRQWLDEQLKSLNIRSASEVFLATVDDYAHLYIDTYKDHLASKVDISDYPGPY